MAGKAEVWGFFHNPNIHPYPEFKKRLDAVKRLSSLFSLNVLFDESYKPREFLIGAREAASGEGRGEGGAGVEGGEAGEGRGRFPGIPEKGKRCAYCYSSRLEETARRAKREGFDAFSTSLLYSRFQDHDEIKALGEAIAMRYSIPFIYSDFRDGWYEGINRSREMGLYRQNYCGCVWSRLEREEEKRQKQLKKVLAGA